VSFIRANPNTVFEALTNPEILNQWFTSGARVDLRVGGEYSNADGDIGTFRMIEPRKKLIFSWDNPQHSPGSQVQITLQEGQDGTEVRIEHSNFASTEEAEDMRLGWQWAAECLKSYLETGDRISFSRWMKARKTSDPS
jgi:uncharacterized protein YndB with AHSA1/START domain